MGRLIWVPLFLLMIGGQALALAPPPINLTKEEVKVNGETFIVEFKNNTLTMRRKKEMGSNVVGLMILLALLFYGGLLLLFLWWKGWLIEGAIVALSVTWVIMTIHIIRKWMKK